MSAPTNKPVDDEILYRFKHYETGNPAWGCMHIVLEDQNIRDSDVQHCIDSAVKEGDKEGEALARILLTMSKSQRLNLTRRISKL